MGRNAARAERGNDASKLDLGKLLSSPAPITWGALLGSLPANVVEDLVERARAINRQLPACTQAEAAELAAVESALATQDTIHQNMFAPFTVDSKKVADKPTVHWGNVDTGAMVNVVYLGVTRVFKGLQQYWQDFNHVITGVGGKKTRIVAKLRDVPLELGETFGAHTPTPATFYVVDSDDYHWILGLPFLGSVEGKVDCKDRVLEFKAVPLNSKAPTATTILPLITRAQARDQPVRALFRLRSPHLEAEPAQIDSWQEALLTSEEVEYVGEGLV